MPRTNRHFIPGDIWHITHRCHKQKFLSNDNRKLTRVDALRLNHGEWISAALTAEMQQREEFWSQSIAVGSEAFVRQAQETLGLKGKTRDMMTTGEAALLRETEEIYGPDFEAENRPIAAKNRLYWKEFI